MKNDKLNKSFKFLLWFTIIIFCLYLITLLIFETIYINPYNIKNAYTIAGIISGIFASISFIGVLWTIYIQNKQIIIQTNQLKLQQSQIIENEQFIYLQRFESTFFKMLDLQQKLISDLSYSDRVPTAITGRDLFIKLYKEIDLPNLINTTGLKGLVEKHGISAYNIDSFSFPSYFDHYFRHLYRIMKFIDSQDEKYLPFTKKYEYTSILRGTLSEYELIWLYYNCLSGPGEEKFKYYLEKYALLKNIRKKRLAQSKECNDNNGSNDYEYYLTIDKNYRDSLNEGKHEIYIGAFFHGEELIQAIEQYKQSTYYKLKYPIITDNN